MVRVGIVTDAKPMARSPAVSHRLSTFTTHSFPRFAFKEAKETTMSVATVAINQMERRLPKVIDARKHGVIDYCHAAFFLGMAYLCRKRDRRAAWAALLTGSFVLVQSLLTDYPLGIKKVIPFRLHGQMDAAFAASSFMVPSIFGFSSSKAASVFKGNSFVEAAVVGATDFNSELARREE